MINNKVGMKIDVVGITRALCKETNKWVDIDQHIGKASCLLKWNKKLRIVEVKG